MITLKEIRTKYRGKRDKDLDMDWWSKYVLGNIAVIFTKLFLYTPITPNQINFLWIIVGILGSISLMFGNYWLSILGAAMLQFYFILDLADGPVARIKNLTSYEGSYIHIMGHNIIDGFTFMGLTIGVFIRYYQEIWVIVIGFLCAISILVYGLVYSRKIDVYFRKGLYKKKLPTKSNSASTLQKNSLLTKIFKMGSYLSGGIPIANFITIAAIFDVLYIPLVFYGLFFPVFTSSVFIYEYFRGFSWIRDIQK